MRLRVGFRVCRVELGFKCSSGTIICQLFSRMPGTSMSNFLSLPTAKVMHTLQPMLQMNMLDSARKPFIRIMFVYWVQVRSAIVSTLNPKC